MQGIRTAALVVAFAALAAPAAHAQYGPPGGELHMAFGSAQPGAETGLNIRLEYRDSTNPDEKPPMIRELRLDMPAGTAFDGSAVPQCQTTDEQLRLLGEAACPAESRVGGGEVVTITGFGPPADPYVLETVLFNEPGGVVELVRDKPTRATIAIEHLRIEGSTVNATIGRVNPGGPPDGQTTVRTVLIDFDAGNGFVTTPPKCRRAGWSYSGRYTFDNGSVEPSGTTRCARSQKAKRTRVKRSARRCARAARSRCRRASR